MHRSKYRSRKRMSTCNHAQSGEHHGKNHSLPISLGQLEFMSFTLIMDDHERGCVNVCQQERAPCVHKFKSIGQHYLPRVDFFIRSTSSKLVLNFHLVSQQQLAPLCEHTQVPVHERFIRMSINNSHGFPCSPLSSIYHHLSSDFAMLNS